MAPLLGRLPIPWIGVTGIACMLGLMGHFDLALAVMIAADAYLRPGEVLGLRKESVVPARPHLGRGHKYTCLILFPMELETPSKGLQYDESIVLDSNGREWLAKALEAHARTCAPQALLFDVRGELFRSLFKEAAVQAGVGHWDPTPHILRHAGPSHDHLNHLRPLPEIQRRGRWASSASVKRYERAAQVNARMTSMPDNVIQFLQESEREVENVIVFRQISDRLRMLAGRARK